MNIAHGAKATVGDINVLITATLPSDMSGQDIRFELIKPSGKTLWLQATVAGDGLSASYTTVDGDFDESGTYRVFAYNYSSGYYFNRESGDNEFYVRPLPTEMVL